MPNEAKVGLVVGVALVIVMAVVFFRRDAAHARSTPEAAAVAAKPPGALASGSAAKRHVVAEGETLFSLARRYYNDSAKFVELYQVNRGVLKTPEALSAGTVLIVPEVRGSGK